MTRNFNKPGEATIGALATGDTPRYLRLDTITHTLQIIDYAHHEVHAGRHFTYSDHVTLADTGVKNYLITTPNTTRWSHFWMDLTGSAITQFEFFEDSTRVGDGTAATLWNSNRNSENLSGMTIHTAITEAGADGNRIKYYKGGAASQQSRSGPSAGNEEELILKQNAKYLLKITSGSADNLVNVRFEWYEHVNRT